MGSEVAESLVEFGPDVLEGRDLYQQLVVLEEVRELSESKVVHDNI